MLPGLVFRQNWSRAPLLLVLIVDASTATSPVAAAPRLHNGRRLANTTSSEPQATAPAIVAPANSTAQAKPTTTAVAALANSTAQAKPTASAVALGNSTAQAKPTAPAVAALANSTARAEPTAPAVQAGMFDCSAGTHLDWPQDKTQWCCSHQQVDCPRPVTGNATGPASAIFSHAPTPVAKTPAAEDTIMGVAATTTTTIARFSSAAAAAPAAKGVAATTAATGALTSTTAKTPAPPAAGHQATAAVGATVTTKTPVPPVTTASKQANRTGEAEGGHQEQRHSASAQREYKCDIRFADRWSAAKRAWCCKHQNKGCPPSTRKRSSEHPHAVPVRHKGPRPAPSAPAPAVQEQSSSIGYGAYFVGLVSLGIPLAIYVKCIRKRDARQYGNTSWSNPASVIGRKTHSYTQMTGMHKSRGNLGNYVPPTI